MKINKIPFVFARTRCRSLVVYCTMSGLVTFQRCFSRKLSYVQGQSPKKGFREYFYYIDHQGMIFLDDAKIKNFTSCFKEKAFLKFFFEKLRINESGKYEEFPYLSPCGREKNYIRCDDLPVVFTHLQEVNGKVCLPFNYCPECLVTFQPEKLYMSVNGRIYHPGPEHLHGVGLIRSQLAIELSQGFQFDDAGIPHHFIFKNQKFKLDYSLKEKLLKIGRQE